MKQERVNCIAGFLAEGHTYKEAAEEFGHDRGRIREWIRDMHNEELREKALKGELFARKYRYVLELRSYVFYMAQFHTEEETMQKFGIDEAELKRAFRILSKYPEHKNLVMMAKAGARHAAKKRQ